MIIVIMLIYIPIWLDLLCSQKLKKDYSKIDLHSNMVRFIMRIKRLYRAIISNIYIPIWLDLL